MLVQIIFPLGGAGWALTVAALTELQGANGNWHPCKSSCTVSAKISLNLQFSFQCAKSCKKLGVCVGPSNFLNQCLLFLGILTLKALSHPLKLVSLKFYIEYFPMKTYMVVRGNTFSRAIFSQYVEVNKNELIELNVDTTVKRIRITSNWQLSVQELLRSWSPLQFVIKSVSYL